MDKGGRGEEQRERVEKKRLETVIEGRIKENDRRKRKRKRAKKEKKRREGEKRKRGGKKRIREI